MSAGEFFSGGYRVTGEGSVLALAWAPSGADLDFLRLFPSHSGRWTLDMKTSTVDHDVFIADCLSTRYFVDPGDAREDLGNVPLDEVLSETVYVSVERWGASASPCDLIYDAMFVTPPADWELIRSVLSPASAEGELPPINYGTDGAEFLEWYFDAPRFSAFLMERADTEIEMTPVDGADSGALRLSGIRVEGADSTVSFLQSEGRFIGIVQIGSVRDDIGHLFELTSEQFAEVHAKPRR